LLAAPCRVHAGPTEPEKTEPETPPAADEDTPAEAPDQPTEATEEPEEPPPEAEPTPDAQELFFQGAARYAAADYAAAIELFTQALELLTTQGGDVSARAALLENLARANTKLFEVNGDADQLRVAQALYKRLLRDADFHRLSEEDVARIEGQLAEVEQKLAEVEAKEREAQRQARLAARPVQPKVDEKALRGARRMTFTGVGIASLGAAMAGVMATGLALGQQSSNKLAGYRIPDEEQERIDEMERGRTMNELAIGAGVTAGVLLVTGAVLIIVGQVKQRRAARGLALKLRTGEGLMGVGVSLGR
jgi:hypothetical protein